MPISDPTLTVSPSAQLRAMAELSWAPMSLHDQRGGLLYANPSARRLFGCEAELESAQVLARIHREDRGTVRKYLADVVANRAGGQAIEFRLKDGAGDWHLIEAIATNLLGEPWEAVLFNLRDVTERHDLERHLRDLAMRDPLTGLANCALLRQQLDTLLQDGQQPSVAVIDVDRFKLVNDSLGRTAGDMVMKALASRIAENVPKAFIARLEGDVFAVVLTRATAMRVERLMWRLLAALANPLFVDRTELQLTASVGISLADEDATTESLLRDANAALQLAKQRGGGRAELCTDQLRDQAIKRLSVEADLRQAIRDRALSLFYQPIVALSSRRRVGAEALLRWFRDGVAVLPTTELIELAEDSGLIVPIGSWVIETAARCLAKSRCNQDRRLDISVNLSARQLASPGLVPEIKRALMTWKLEPASLVFEVTETLVIQDFDLANSVLGRIRQLGCRVGLDDFGTGYSSLAYLRRLPVDYIKIDRFLTEHVDKDVQSIAIVQAVVTMARALGLPTVAEGVERPAQARLLAELGCRYGQGYLFGEPKPGPPCPPQ